MCAIVIIILVTIFSSVYGHGSKHLENAQFSFSHEGIILLMLVVAPMFLQIITIKTQPKMMEVVSINA